MCLYPRLYILAMDGVPKLTAKELKSQQAREWYTALSVEEKAALVQRNRENRERKNSASISGTGSQTVNCQPSFQPVPSSTPMSFSTPEVRNSMFKEPVLYDAIKIGVNFRNQELLQPAEQNNAPGEPEVVIVEDDEVCERNMASSGAGRDERWILAGATALVTGSSKGIGRAIVEELVGFGSTVHTCARSEAELSRCQEELTAKGLAVSFSVCDVSVRTDREELVSRVRELFGGKLNILVNNAGLTLSKLTLETTTSDYTQQMSCFHLSQLLHPLLKASERGSIINISSISSYLAYPYLAVYSAAKVLIAGLFFLLLVPIAGLSGAASDGGFPFVLWWCLLSKGWQCYNHVRRLRLVGARAMNQFSKALASDWAGDNIRINCVAPGLTRTPLLEEYRHDGGRVRDDGSPVDVRGGARRGAQGRRCRGDGEGQTRPWLAEGWHVAAGDGGGGRRMHRLHGNVGSEEGDNADDDGAGTATYDRERLVVTRDEWISFSVTLFLLSTPLRGAFAASLLAFWRSITPSGGRLGASVFSIVCCEELPTLDGGVFFFVFTGYNLAELHPQKNILSVGVGMNKSI
uniref:Uncharacterized protein n=1 Tax=Oryza glumipatula TaxID=40148 RepID=A0A0E0BIP6_9ORYZ